jgi:hypothetical protein
MVGDIGGVPPQFLNCDGKVDGKDSSLFLQCFKGQGPPRPWHMKQNNTVTVVPEFPVHAAYVPSHASQLKLGLYSGALTRLRPLRLYYRKQGKTRTRRRKKWVLGRYLHSLL